MSKSSKWALGLFGFLILLLVVGVGVSRVLRHRVAQGTVLKLSLSGPISESPRQSIGSVLSGDRPLDLNDIVRGIERAAADERIAGLVLNIRGSAFGLAQLQEFAAAMKTFREADKWTTAYIESASIGGRGDLLYATAVCADHVVLAPSGDIALAGMQVNVPFLKGTFDRLKLEPHFFKRKEYKNFANTFTESGFTAAHRRALTGYIDDAQGLLIDHFAARRNVPRTTVRQWLDNGPYDSEEAFKRGIIDGRGYWDSVISLAQEKAGAGDEQVDPESGESGESSESGDSGTSGDAGQKLAARTAERRDQEHGLMAFSEYISRHPANDSGPEFAIIVGEGTIHRGTSQGGLSSPTIGSDTMTQALRDARKANVKGIVLRVNSGGGGYVASDLIRREIELCQEAGIPVVASMGNMAASGGYLISMQADEIVADPGTLTGSIGVVLGRFATRRFFNEFLGITWDSYSTSAKAALFSSLDNPTDEQRASMDHMADRIYTEFVAGAAAARQQSFDDLEQVARGRIWSGAAALKHGLIDRLGGQTTAMKSVLALAKLEPRFATIDDVAWSVFPRPKKGLDVLLEAATSQSGGSMARLLSENLPMTVQPEARALLDALRPRGLVELPLQLRFE